MTDKFEGVTSTCRVSRELSPIVRVRLLTFQEKKIASYFVCIMKISMNCENQKSHSKYVPKFLISMIGELATSFK